MPTQRPDPHPDTAPEYLTVTDVAHRLNVSPKFVRTLIRTLIRTRRLPALDLGTPHHPGPYRITTTDLRDYINRRRTR